MCQGMCACVCMYVFACTCARGDQRSTLFVETRSLTEPRVPWLGRQVVQRTPGSQLSLHFPELRLQVYPSIPGFYVVARDTSSCLPSKHFTQRAISARLCFVNVYSYLLKYKQVFTIIICSNIFSPSFPLGSPFIHMLIQPILYFTHKTTFHDLLCLV